MLSFEIPLSVYGNLSLDVAHGGRATIIDLS